MTIKLSKNDEENKKFYNRMHFFGFEEEKEFEALLDEMDEDDDEDDILICENF
jgi:hypothetical protein